MEQDKYLDKYAEICSKYKKTTTKFYSGMIDYRQGLIDEIKDLVKYGEIVDVIVEKFTQPLNHPLICNIGLQFSYPVSPAHVYLLTWVKHRAGILTQGKFKSEGKEEVFSLHQESDVEIKKAFNECETPDEFKKRCPIFYYRRGYIVKGVYKRINANKEVLAWCNSKMSSIVSKQENDKHTPSDH